MDRDQAFLFLPDMREWLPADHPVHLVITVVEDHLDTSAFRAARKTADDSNWPRLGACLRWTAGGVFPVPARNAQPLRRDWNRSGRDPIP